MYISTSLMLTVIQAAISILVLLISTSEVDIIKILGLCTKFLFSRILIIAQFNKFLLSFKNL